MRNNLFPYQYSILLFDIEPNLVLNGHACGTLRQDFRAHMFSTWNTRVKLIKPLRPGHESNARTQTPPLSVHVLSEDNTQHSKRAVKYLLYGIRLIHYSV